MQSGQQDSDPVNQVRESCHTFSLHQHETISLFWLKPEMAFASLMLPTEMDTSKTGAGEGGGGGGGEGEGGGDRIEKNHPNALKHFM